MHESGGGVTVDGRVRKISRRRALVLAGVAVAAPAVLACAPIAPRSAATAPASSQTPKRGGLLKIAMSRDILTFDPFILSGGVLLNNIYDVLTRYDASGRPQPQLAERWEFEDDGRRLVVHLRPGVTFHNGRSLVADDVVFTLKRAQDAAVAANIRPLALLVQSAEARDERTVVLRFEKPNAGVFDLFDLLFIQNKETIDSIKSRGIGTGPFKFVEWNPGSTIRLARNQNYWQPGKPYLDELVFQIAPDAQAMVLQLEAGAVDLAQYPPPRDVRRLRTTAGFTVTDGNLGTEQYGVVLNVTRKPFDNPKVREAVKWAIDRQRFIDTALAGQGEPWCLPWPKTSVGVVAELGSSGGHDPPRAMRLRVEAGLADGFETSILASTGDLLSAPLQADLAAVGIRAKIDIREEAVARPRRVSGDFDIGLALYQRATKDPSSLLQTTIFWNPLTGNSHFRDPEYTRLVAEGAATLDTAKRREIYRKVTEIIVKENFVIPVSTSARNWAMRDVVRGFAPSLDNYELFSETWLAS